MFNFPGQKPGLLGGTPSQFSMLGYSPMQRPGMGGGGMLGGQGMGGGTPMPAYQPQRFAAPSFQGNLTLPQPAGFGGETLGPGIYSAIPTSRGGGQRGINGQTPPPGWTPIAHEDGTIFSYMNPRNPWEHFYGYGGGGGPGSGNLYMGGIGDGTAGDDGGMGDAGPDGIGGDGNNGAGDADGFARGGPVSAGRLAGPNPPGPDDGHAALDAGEYVVRASQAKKYQGLLSAINSGASKKQLRGLLG
jgi:hypothetical protein